VLFAWNLNVCTRRGRPSAVLTHWISAKTLVRCRAHPRGPHSSLHAGSPANDRAAPERMASLARTHLRPGAATSTEGAVLIVAAGRVAADARCPCSCYFLHRYCRAHAPTCPLLPHLCAPSPPAAAISARAPAPFAAGCCWLLLLAAAAALEWRSRTTPDLRLSPLAGAADAFAGARPKPCAVLIRVVAAIAIVRIGAERDG
jgi:hypothetical protein